MRQAARIGSIWAGLLLFAAGCSSGGGRSLASVPEAPSPSAEALVGEYSGLSPLGNGCHVSIVRDGQSPNGDSLSVAISFQPNEQSKVVPGPERIYGVNIAILNREISRSDQWHKDPQTGDDGRESLSVGYDDDPPPTYPRADPSNFLVNFEWNRGSLHEVEINGNLHTADMLCMVGARH